MLAARSTRDDAALRLAGGAHALRGSPLTPTGRSTTIHATVTHPLRSPAPVRRLFAGLIAILALSVASVASALPFSESVHESARVAKVRRTECIVAGPWRGTAVDEQGTRWRFALTLEQNGSAVSGAFDWVGSNGSRGRERVAGTVDCPGRQLTMRGVALESANSLALARYALRLDALYTALDGRWTGGVPGTMSGRRVTTP